MNDFSSVHEDTGAEVAPTRVEAENLAASPPIPLHEPTNHGERLAYIEIAINHLWHHLSEGTIQGLDDFKSHWKAKMEMDRK